MKRMITNVVNVILLACLLFSVSTKGASAEPINTRTDNNPNTIIDKPAKLRLFLPWRDGEKGWLGGNDYNKSGTDHTNMQYYAIDFNLQPNNQHYPVYPTAPGNLVYADWINGGFGNTVILRHDIGDSNYYFSLYAHLQDINQSLYKKGVKDNSPSVEFNTELGREGMTGGTSTSDHLHFALFSCPKSEYDNIFVGMQPLYLFNAKDGVQLCQSVKPEPIIGKHVYESLKAYNRLNQKINPCTLGEGYDIEKEGCLISDRPSDYSADTVAPTGTWDQGSSQGDILPGEKVRFNIKYQDVGSQVTEVRLTLYYRDWTIYPYTDSNQFPDLYFKWPIIARCDPRRGPCGMGAWNYEWDPHTILNNSLSDTRENLLKIPWMPPIKSFNTSQPIDACISFDVFDEYGNSTYAPGGVRCDAAFNALSLGNSIEDVQAIQEDSQIRVIRILPQSYISVQNDQVTFNSDLSLPDGTIMSPNQSLTKTWRLKNTGPTIWGSGYQLAFLRGDRLSAPAAIDVPSTASGQTVDLSVPITSPSSPGSYKGYWQMRNPQGTYFGPEIWISITVQDNAPPPAGEEFTLECTNCPSSVPPGYVFVPNIKVRVNNGQLLASRGDMLRNIDNNLFGAYPHVAINGIVNSGQSIDLSFYSDHPITAPQQNGTYESKWQIWRNGGYAGPELVIRFAVGDQSSINRSPNSPTLTGPGDWAVYTGNGGIVLSANHNGDPDGDPITYYYFEIFESAQNANSGWITSNQWSPQGLGYNNYQWRVKVRDSRGAESNWSQQVWHFTVQTNEPQISSFYSTQCRPAWDDGNPTTDKICFCATTNAGTIKLMVNSATDGSATGQWQILNELGTSSYSCNSDADRPPKWEQVEYESGRHLVRLYARRDSGWESAAHRDIIVDLATNRRPNGPLGRIWYHPEDTQPTYDSYLDNQTVHFDWHETFRTTSYRLQANTSQDFTGTVLIDTNFPVSTTEYVHTFDKDYETIYWRVTAIGPYGQTTSGSTFHIDTTSPSSSVTALPAVSFDNQLTLNWSGTDSRSGLRWYDVQVRDGDRPDSQWTDWQTNTTKTAEIFQGQVGHTYYFRVRAMDQVGNWEAWSVGDGDTFTKIDLTTAPQTPWWDAGYAFRRNVVVLNNDSDTMPVHFPVRLHFDEFTTPSSVEIYNASSASIKGNDVRIVLNNTTELSRFIQRFGADQIDIWFPIQTSMTSGAANSASYQLYYGNGSANNPPAGLNEIFLPQVDGNTVGFWRFQEGAGSTVNDSSGRGHHGVFYNPGWSDGIMGSTGYFNGSNAYVQIPHSPDLNLGSMTLEAWIYLNGSAGDHPMIINKDYYWLKLDGDRNVLFGINADGGTRVIKSNYQLNMYQWYHVAATYDGNGHIKLFINGNEFNSINENPLNILYTSLPLRIGRISVADSNGTAYFPGFIQNVHISNIARTNFSYAKIDIQPSVTVGIQQIQPAIGNPDLAVQSLNAYSNSAGGLLVEAVVKNQGAKSTTNGFYTDLYVDHLPTGAGDYEGSLQFWVNDPIPAGSTAVLTTLIEDPISIGLQSVIPGEERSWTLYAQTDSTGAINETDKTNNITATGTDICIAAGDAYEGNDNNYTGAVPFSGNQVHNFDRPGDEDWVKFVAKQGQTYRFTTSNLGAGADTYLYLYDQDGVTLLASNDDYGGTLASQIEWTAPVDGTYYIQSKQWNPSSGGCGTSYTLVLGGGINLYIPLVSR